jgi:hypothetical protein
VADA